MICTENKVGNSVNNIRIFLVVIMMAFVAGCATAKNASGVQLPDPFPAKKQRQAGSAAVFERKGEYETVASFKRRRDAAARADKFFLALSRDNCLFKDGMKHICYRASAGGILQVYNEGDVDPQEHWRRLNDAICIRNQCQPVTTYKVQTYNEYLRLIHELGKDTPEENVKTLEMLRNERVELNTKTMLCFSCKNGAWPTSRIVLYDDAPQCIEAVKNHVMQYGGLDIKKSLMNVTETDQKYNFFTGLEVEYRKAKPGVIIITRSVNKAEICDQVSAGY